MKHRIIFIFFICSLFSQKGYSQRCGGGKLRFNIYTLNGTEIKNFEYEILPVSKELLQEKLYKKVVTEVNLRNPNYIFFQNINNSGVIISEQYVNEIIEPNNNKLNESLDKNLDISKISKTGKIKSSLFFITHENNNFPIILKICHERKVIYILGNYFGGCDREASLIWNNGYGKLN